MLRHLPSPILLVALALASGCSRPPPAEQAAGLAAEIATLRASLPADPTADEASAIAKPAKRAARAYTALLDLETENPADPAVAAARATAEPVASEIRRIQRLATERHDLADLMGGLKVRGYRAARSHAVPKLLELLAAAARHAAEADLESLPGLVREAAELAAALADVRPGEPSAGQPHPALTRADWLRAAERIDSFNRAEPPEFALGLALAHAVLGKSGFALVELERCDAAKFEPASHAALVPLARAFVFSRLGFTALAGREASKTSGDTESGRQLLAAIHATLAYCHAAEKDWRQMDRELGEAVRIWPDNPLVVFLAGERLLADGRREEALETFGRVTAGTEAAWLAPLIEERVRAVRDSTGEVPPLVLDNSFILKAALLSLRQEARGADTGRLFAKLCDAAQRLPALLGREDAAAAPSP